MSPTSRRSSRSPRARRSSRSRVSATSIGTLIVLAIFFGIFILANSDRLGSGNSNPAAGGTLAPTLGAPATASGALATAQAAATAGDYSVYFTNRHSPQAANYRGGPDEALAQAIRQAQASVDVAAYQLNLWSIQNALLEAHQRGVAVRMVTDSNFLDEDEVQRLMSAGIEVLGDRREGLMHNKFVVVDGQEVWTGSMNLTINGAYRNDNNLLRIHSLPMAQNYTAEFEEMFVSDQFGGGSPANTPNPSFLLHDTQVEVYFSPEDGVAQRLVALLRQAQHSVHFLAFSFTSDDLANALLDRAQAGVTVSGVMEAAQYASNTGTEYDRFRQAGLDVRLDGNPEDMHHKVFIIDQQIVVTGSYNFSSNAENRNDENVVILYSPDIAAQYLQEFQRIQAEAQAVQP